MGVYAIAEAVKKVGNPDDSDALVKALEGLEVPAARGPRGDFTSYIDPASAPDRPGAGHRRDRAQHQDFPPATRMLGQWKVYKAEDLLPPKEWADKNKK